MSFQYFGFGEERRFQFLQLPLLLYSDERFKGLHGDAKTIYAFMLDRTWLSRENGWIDEQGHAFIYFTFEEIHRVLGIGHTRAAKLLKSLEDYGLILRVRQGFNKPNRIYVGAFYQDESFQEYRNYQIGKSGTPDSGIQELPIQETTYTEKNHTEEIQTLSIHPDDAMDERSALADYFEKQCNFDILKEDYKFQDEELDGIRDILIDTCSSKAKTIRISGEEMPIKVVKSRFMKLNSEHIRYVMDCLKENTSGVTNIRAYLLTVLYHAPTTIGHYYRQMVNYDMAHWNEKQE